jgi:large subunit ribosomal protein L5
MKARLKEHYLKNGGSGADQGVRYTNVMAVPKLEKITMNIGMGEATQNAKLMDVR